MNLSLLIEIPFKPNGLICGNYFTLYICKDRAKEDRLPAGQISPPDEFDSAILLQKRTATL